MTEREALNNVRPFRPHVLNVVPIDRRLRTDEWQRLGDPYAEQCEQVVTRIYTELIRGSEDDAA